MSCMSAEWWCMRHARRVANLLEGQSGAPTTITRHNFRVFSSKLTFARQKQRATVREAIQGETIRLKRQ